MEENQQQEQPQEKLVLRTEGLIKRYGKRTVVPNGGHIYLGDEEVTKYPVYKRARAGIGYLAQEASVFRKMSVEDNILSVLEMTGKPRDYQLNKLEDLIKEFRH